MRQERQAPTAAIDHDEDPLDDLPIGVLIFVDGDLVRINDGWVTASGLDWRASVADGWLQAIHPADRAAAQELIDPQNPERVRTCDLRVLYRGEASRQVWVHGRSRIVGEHPPMCIVTLTEIAARKDQELRLLHLTTHDPLTGLVNRSGFLSKLEGTLGASDAETTTAVLFIDLDRFKSVNDRFGHSFGDIVLAAVARRLEGLARPVDTVARLGGDEFAILFTGVERNVDASQLAERVVNTLSAPFVIADNAVVVGASVGIALDAAGRNALGLVEQADRAMYRAKAGGGSQWAFPVDDDAITPTPPEGPDAVQQVQNALRANELAVLDLVLSGPDPSSDPEVRALFARLAAIVAASADPTK